MVEEDMDSLERRQDMAHLEHQQDMASLIYWEDSFLDLVAALDDGVVLVDISAVEAVPGGDDPGVLIEPARKEANLT
jgi:hypothetical protein